MCSKYSEAQKCANTLGLLSNKTGKGNIDMNSVQNNELTFHNTTFSYMEMAGQIWLTAAEVGEALGYSDDKAIHRLYRKHADEFTVNMTGVVKVTTPGGVQDTRVFSLRGAHLIGMFSRTAVAKKFRHWVLDVLDKEVHASPIATGHYHFPVETADPHDRKFGNAWMTPRVILDERNRAPELELLEVLEKDGYDITGAKIRIHAMYGIAQQFVEMQKELTFAKRLMTSLNDVITNQTHERGANVSFTGKERGIAYGGLTKRKLN